MKYDVHIYLTTRFKVEGVEAPDMQAAMDAAVTQTAKDIGLEEAAKRGEYADEITAFLVDVCGDDEYAETESFDADGRPSGHPDHLASQYATELRDALRAMLDVQSKRRHPLGQPDEGIACEAADAASKARAALAKVGSRGMTELYDELAAFARTIARFTRAADADDSIDTVNSLRRRARDLVAKLDVANKVTPAERSHGQSAGAVTALERNLLNALTSTEDFAVEVVSTPGYPCLVVNNHRVAGMKPWGGGQVMYRWHLPLSEVLAALPEVQGALAAITKARS